MTELDNQYRKALEDGNLEEVKRIVELREKIHALDIGVLHTAIENGHIPSEYLSEKAKDTEVYNDWALRHAARYGHLPVLKYLFKKGADIHAVNDCALCWAAENVHFEIVDYLIDNGADWQNHFNDFPTEIQMHILSQKSKKCG